MRKILLGVLLPLFAMTIFLSEADAARRHRVYINKPSPVCSTPGCDQWSKGNIPLVAVPLIAVVFDIARRTSCDPRVAVGTGPGDPGFDPAGPKIGNFLVPAIYRSECRGIRPKWYGW
jgi:hypothetical protein